MRWARSTGTLFFLAGGIIGAQSAENGITGLEACFQAARTADATCSTLTNDPAMRLDCLEKTRSAQLECLEHVLSEAHAAPPVAQESLGSQPGPPDAQQSRSRDASISTGHTGSMTTRDESIRLGESNSLLRATVKANPTEPGSPPPADAAAFGRFSKDAAIRHHGLHRSTTTPTEDLLFQTSDSPRAASAMISLDRTSPTDATTSQRSPEKASIKQTGASRSTTTPTENRLPAAKRSSADVSTKQIEGIPSPAGSTEQLLQATNGPSQIIAGTKERTGSWSATSAAAPPAPFGDSAPKQASLASPSGRSADSSPIQQTDSPPNPTIATNPGGRPTSSPATNATVAAGSSKEVLPEQPGDSKVPAVLTASHSPQNSNGAPKATSTTILPQRPVANVSTTGAISPGLPLKPAIQSRQPISSDWLVSETTSPIDYSPLVTALIRSTSQVKDAPNTLIIRCRGRRTELVVRTDGAWRTPRGGETQGAYQINEHPAVGQRWMISPDGKSATYKDDVVELLQALPDDASLKINLADQASSSHEATFHLGGWGAVGQKISTACRWSLTADQGLSQRK
jgi:hypothetical protein